MQSGVSEDGARGNHNKVVIIGTEIGKRVVVLAAHNNSIIIVRNLMAALSVVVGNNPHAFCII